MKIIPLKGRYINTRFRRTDNYQEIIYYVGQIDEDDDYIITFEYLGNYHKIFKDENWLNVNFGKGLIIKYENNSK